MTDWANTNYNNVSMGSIRKYTLNGVLHRLDGPAKEYINNHCYYYAGAPHRADGPAEKWHGKETWYYHGVHSSKEFVELMESFKTRLNTIEEELKSYRNKVTVYETFVDTLNNALTDTQSDTVEISKEVIDTIIDKVKN